MMLYRFLSAMSSHSSQHNVISLTDIGPIGKRIETLGVPVRALGICSGLPSPLLIFKLAKWLKEMNPDVVQTWMYHADLIGGLAAKIADKSPVVWGIHNSNLDIQYNKRSTILIVKLCSKLSRWLPERIIYVSHGARKIHEKYGYMPEKTIVIPNGIDTAVFKPNSESRLSVRRELGVDDSATLIGLISRFNSQKDHRNFIQAAKLIRVSHPNVQFLLCGTGINWDNEKLALWIDDASLMLCFHLLGVRGDVPRITSALDIATSSSFGESFSLTLGEAMASKVPCVTTDIEGPVDLLGGHGWVVPIGDANAMCQAWKEMLSVPSGIMVHQLEQARKRIVKNFSLETMADNYLHLYMSLLSSNS